MVHIASPALSSSDVPFFINDNLMKESPQCNNYIRYGGNATMKIDIS